ncbi:hypothetical protein ES705_28074 [subsurface metagenome]
MRYFKEEKTIVRTYGAIENPVVGTLISKECKFEFPDLRYPEFYLLALYCHYTLYDDSKYITRYSGNLWGNIKLEMHFEASTMDIGDKMAINNYYQHDSCSAFYDFDTYYDLHNNPILIYHNWLSLTPSVVVYDYTPVGVINWTWSFVFSIGFRRYDK